MSQMEQKRSTKARSAAGGRHTAAIDPNTGADQRSHATLDARPVTREEIWLLGQPSLQDYLSFVQHNVENGADADRSSLIDEWRAANDHYHALEEREAGIADRAESRPLDPALTDLAEDVMADPRYHHTFDAVPTSFAMVELDRLVVYQTRVTGDFVERLKTRLDPAPDAKALFRFCLPLGTPEPDVRIRRMGSRRYVFLSESTDFRFHEPVLLRPDQISDYSSFGPIGGVIGLVAGFGSNFLNVVRDENRLILNNGYHRAVALRSLGITHAPCVVQLVTRRDELDVVGPQAVADDPAFYFKAPRPPLLKDFFDPKIRKVLRTYKTLKMIEVNFEVRSFEVVD